MSPDEDDHEEGVMYDLVVPFVVCTSTGGPYDDEAFAAGFHVGQIDVLLAQDIAEMEMTVRTATVAQLDLIAMRWGYEMEQQLTDDDQWMFAIFRKKT